MVRLLLLLGLLAALIFWTALAMRAGEYKASASASSKPLLLALLLLLLKLFFFFGRFRFFVGPLWLLVPDCFGGEMDDLDASVVVRL